MVEEEEATPKRILRGGAHELPTVLCPRCRRAMAVSRIHKDVKIKGIFGGESTETHTFLKYHCPDCGTTWEEEEKPKSDCFIATAAYGTPFATEIQILRKWRDLSLKNSFFGNTFVNIYYFISPPIAKFIEDKNLLKALTRKILKPIIEHLKRKYS